MEPFQNFSKQTFKESALDRKFWVKELDSRASREYPREIA
jgi:hypothetical protein